MSVVDRQYIREEIRMGDTMKENTPGRDGVNFEKFLIDLIADSNV